MRQPRFVLEQNRETPWLFMFRHSFLSVLGLPDPSRTSKQQSREDARSATARVPAPLWPDLRESIANSTSLISPVRPGCSAVPHSLSAEAEQ